MCVSYGIIEGLTRISRILLRCITPRIALSLFFVSHRFHRFTQIFSLQATVVTMPHSNRYFSARELRIFFGTRIARITRICCLVSKDSRDSRDSCSPSSYSILLITLQGLPAAIQFAGISFTTTEPAPITEPSPIVTPLRMILLAPIST